MFLHDMEHLKKFDIKSYLHVKHVGNLGEVVNDFKQENQNLAQENTKLRKRLQELEKMSLDVRSSCAKDLAGFRSWEEKMYSLPETSNSDDHEVVMNKTIATFIVSGNESSVLQDFVTTSAFGCVTQTMFDKANPNLEASNLQENIPELGYFETQTEAVVDESAMPPVVIDVNDFASSKHEKVNESTIPQFNKNSSGDLESRDVMSNVDDVAITLQQAEVNFQQVESVVNESSNFNEQICQLEEMFGIRRSSISPNDVSNSMTSQFAKVAAAFASLSYNVVQSQKKVWKSQAFCDALMGDNQKTKRLLKEAQQKVETLKTENERLKQKFPAVIPSTSKVLTTTTVNQKASTSANMLDTSEMSLVLKLQARVKKLETQRTEILRVNKAWDTQYKCLKQELDRRTRDGECSQRNREKDDTRSYNDVDFSAAKREIRTHIHEKSDLARNYANAHAQCQKLKGEMVHLKDSIRKYKSDKSYLEAENQRLTQALEAAHSFHERQSLPSQPDDLLLAMVGNRNHGKKFNLIMADETYNQLPSSPLSPIQEVREPSSSNLFRSNPEIDDLRTKIEVLQEQVKIYREDFETERRDREKTQSEKQRFEELLTKAKHQVQALTQQLNTHQHDFRQEKRDKERLQRQLEWANARDPTNAQNRDRHNDDLNDPPAYYAHRFTGNDDVLNGFNNVSRRRMRQHNY